jgi:hypothetical protein
MRLSLLPFLTGILFGSVPFIGSRIPFLRDGDYITFIAHTTERP